LGFFRRFRRDQRGVSAVEFALIAPFMILLYFGLVELCQALIAERKASHVASAVGDLVAQSESVTKAAAGAGPTSLVDIYSIGNSIMAPFPTTNLKIGITSVTADVNGIPKVDWSNAYNGFPVKAPKATVTLPMTLSAGDSIVMAEASYTYNSPIGYVLPKVQNFSEVFYLRPRRSDKVVCTDCPTS
jgi:Flp pilus assembly protein TadG